MKAAAIFVPLALFLLPTFLTVAATISYSMRGKGDEMSRPIPQRKAKRFLILIYIHMCVIFPASAAWSAYVFTGHIWLSVLFFLTWSLPVLAIVLLARRKIPKPPPGGWPDDKAQVEAYNKWRDAQQKKTDKEQEQRYEEVESIVMGLFRKRGWLFYTRLIAGIILLLFGLFMILNAMMDISIPPSELSVAANVVIMIFAGILPFAGGIALCVFAGKKWRKPKAKQQTSDID